MIKTWQQRCEGHPDHEGVVTEQMIRDRMQEEIDELRQALAQTEQEPVAWANSSDLQNFDMRVRTNRDHYHTVPLYTAPPKREWVGLTDEELREAYCKVSGKEWCLGGLANAHTFYEAIEAKLKDKNT